MFVCIGLRLLVRVVKAVFLETSVFAPRPKQVVLTKNGENDGLHSTHKKQGASLLRPRKPTIMTKMAGVAQAKPPFEKKNTVFATPSLRFHPCVCLHLCAFARVCLPSLCRAPLCVPLINGSGCHRFRLTSLNCKASHVCFREWLDSCSCVGCTRRGLCSAKGLVSGS